jgi:hypothetical protein
MVAAIGALFLLLTYVFNEFQINNTYQPENSLPVALITATVILMLALGVTVVVYARLGLANKQTALGLPEGSVRAVIALLLILLFFIAAIFLYADTSRTDERRLVGVTADRLSGIPVEQIIDQRPSNVGDGLFDVTYSSPRSAGSLDIAKQLLTTVSTLVVAVAAFYFGANSVQTATRTALELDQGDGTGPATAGVLPPSQPPGGPAPPATATTPPATGTSQPTGAQIDPAIAVDPLGGAATEEARLEHERSLLVPTDNSPRHEDGEQPAEVAD